MCILKKTSETEQTVLYQWEPSHPEVRRHEPSVAKFETLQLIYSSLLNNEANSCAQLK